MKKSIPLVADFIYLATSAEFAGPINRPTAVKGLRFNRKKTICTGKFTSADGLETVVQMSKWIVLMICSDDAMQPDHQHSKAVFLVALRTCSMCYIIISYLKRKGQNR